MKKEKILITGDSDYPTKDRTGVRDYIHVMDMAEGHVKGLEEMIEHVYKFFKRGDLNLCRK